MKVHYCKFCGELFEAKRSTAKFCSDKHRVAYSRGMDTEMPSIEVHLANSRDILQKNYPLLKSEFDIIAARDGNDVLNTVIQSIITVLMYETTQ